MIRKLTTRRAVGLAAAAVAVAPVLAFSAARAAGTGSIRPTPPPTKTVPPPTLPGPETCTTIAYEAAKVVPLPRYTAYTPFPSYQLVVTGKTAYFNQRVKLVPLVYIRQPEYWGIQVQGCLSGDVGLPAEKPFTVTLDLRGTLGTLGVEVIGANRRERFDVPPGVPVPTTKPTIPKDPIVPPPV
jgi:hypothetical protein